MLGNLLSGLVLVFLMVVATGVAINQFEKLALELRMKRLLLASILVGLSTSLPELFITITSSLEGAGQIALGDLIGANIANLSWVIGGAAIIGHTIPVVGEYIREDLWITMVLAMTPFVLMMDGNLSRFDGLLLLFGYLLYVKDLIVKGRYRIKQEKLNRRLVISHHRLSVVVRAKHIVKLVLALVVLVACTDRLIDVATAVAIRLGAGTFWVGVVILAFGTTLPEVIVSIEAVRRREASLVLGNLLGSVVVNSSLIMGLCALIQPIVFDENLSKSLSGVFTVAVLGLFWLFSRTKHKLDRWEGVVLVGVYLMFVGMQFLYLR